MAKKNSDSIQDSNAIGVASGDLFGPVPTYRRWEFAFTFETWALPLCITRFHCRALTIQLLCLELHTSIAHRWPNAALCDPAHGDAGKPETL